MSRFAPGINELLQQIRSNPRTKFIPVVQQSASRYPDANDVDLLIARVRTLLEFRSYLDTCEKAAFTDHLTDLANRRRFERQLEIEVAGTLQKIQSEFCLVLIDIDHFKRVNDNHGHQIGDQVIKLIAQKLQAFARPIDLAARIGGEEFDLILAEICLASAMEVAEGVRHAIKADELPEVGQVTVSLGVAEFGLCAQTAKQLFGSADTALYEAKRKGRDRVEVAKPIAR